jgi:hypothetical protein
MEGAEPGPRVADQALGRADRGLARIAHVLGKGVTKGGLQRGVDRF